STVRAVRAGKRIAARIGTEELTQFLIMSRLLLIEDDVSLRRVMAQILTRAGYTVSEARNGRVAIKVLAETPIDVVVTDMIMPEMEGVETIRFLRREYPAIKIVAISGGGI